MDEKITQLLDSPFDRLYTIHISKMEKKSLPNKNTDPQLLYCHTYYWRILYFKFCVLSLC